MTKPMPPWDADRVSRVGAIEVIADRFRLLMQKLRPTGPPVRPVRKFGAN
jgi:hypothetical protein